MTQQGSAGKDSVTYEVTTTNGAETGKTEVARTAITPAQATVIAVGTKAGSSGRASSSSSIVRRQQLLDSSSAGSSSSASTGSSSLQLGAGLLRILGHQLGRNRQLRVDQQLVDQHR